MIAVSVIKYQYFIYSNSILTAALWIRYSYHPHCQVRKLRHERLGNLPKVTCKCVPGIQTKVDGLVAKLCLTFVTLWTVACQAPLSMGFSRQAHWSGLPFLSLADIQADDVMLLTSTDMCSFIFYLHPTFEEELCDIFFYIISPLGLPRAIEEVSIILLFTPYQDP